MAALWNTRVKSCFFFFTSIIFSSLKSTLKVRNHSVKLSHKNVMIKTIKCYLKTVIKFNKLTIVSIPLFVSYTVLVEYWGICMLQNCLPFWQKSSNICFDIIFSNIHFQSEPIKSRLVKEIYAKAILWLLSRSGGKFRTYYKVKGLTTLDSSVIWFNAKWYISSFIIFFKICWTEKKIVNCILYCQKKSLK